MNEPLIITASDPILSSLDFKPYRSAIERKVAIFLPSPESPQTMEVNTPWGARFLAKSGDFLVSEFDTPNDFWPVDPMIFEETYMVTHPGYCIKRAITWLVPLVDLTGGDEQQLITVVTLEGLATVRAGDFYLAKGIKGEIWPYPKEKIGDVMLPAE